MRKNESEQIAEKYKNAGFSNFIVEDASESFLNAVKGLIDPQQKRKAVGENFITVRNEVVARLNLNEDDWLLAQGTLYPDIIESGGTKNSNVIKTHHNRVDGIQALIEKGLIIEPLKDLYKDEVRIMGKMLELPEDMVMRHPFPGPGLSINVLCSNGIFTEEDKVEFDTAKQKLNDIKLDIEVLKRGVLPVRSVGVQGDFRTYRFPAVLSPKLTEEAAESKGIYPGWDAFEKASSTITNSIKEVNRTVLALYEKPGCVLQEAYCTKDRLDQTRAVDDIMLDELKKAGWYGKVFQHLTICIPYSTTKETCSIVLRPVVSEDVMTARFAHLPRQLVERVVTRIMNLGFVDSIFYDITNKPPATFGWE